jgi:hypothetical protein
MITTEKTSEVKTDEENEFLDMTADKDFHSVPQQVPYSIVEKCMRAVKNFNDKALCMLPSPASTYHCKHGLSIIT